MTAIQPPLGITTLTDGTPAQHPAALFRRLVELLADGQTGVRETGDMAVTANGTPNMTVNVAAGEALIPGTQQPASQGSYYIFNDATVNLAIAASDATNARRDLVVARVYDRDYAGTTGEWQLEVVTGTPAASPADPATPADSLLLARVDVAAAASSISSGNITDLRSRLFGGTAKSAASSAPLTLTTTPTALAGATFTITVPGTYLLSAVFDIDAQATGGGLVVGQVGVNGTAQPSLALSSVLGRVTVASLNLVTLGAGTQTVNLAAYKASAGGTVVVQAQHTRLTAIRAS